MQSMCLTTCRPCSFLAVELNSNRQVGHMAHFKASSLPHPLFNLLTSHGFGFGFGFGSGIGIGGEKKQKQKRGCGGVCRASYLPIHPSTLQWLSAVATAVLMLTKGTAINKSYLVPLFALQAPSTVISWIKGDYGAWSAFLALFVRLFFFLPGDLELPLMALLLLIVAPHQALSFRGSQPSCIISLAIAAYLAFQHFSHEGSLKKALSQGGLIATVAITLITVIPVLLFI